MKKLFFLLYLIAPLAILAQSPLFEGAPRFHGTTVVGCRPGTPFLYTVAASGLRPIRFSTDELPQGLSMDATTGIISGTIATSGRYSLYIHAENKIGAAAETITLHIGDTLSLTPPMGWNSWNVFTSEVSESLLISMADAMIATGMRDLGYTYINIDDFWHGAARTADGQPTVDSIRFPHGMKYVADYMHAHGLKLGIYSCAGAKTCGKCFGGFEHEETDARVYADWGIDLLKYDYCYAPWAKKAAIQRYTRMGQALRSTSRSIVFNVCEWGLRRPWTWAAQAGSSYWRVTPDIFDTWDQGNPWQYSVKHILRRELRLSPYAGPGHWNDPDMLIVGNHGQGRATSAYGRYEGMTEEEYRSHFALWCMLSAPLLASADLRTISKEDLDILTNPSLIRIDQDPTGHQARRVYTDAGVWVYRKELADSSSAVAILNTGSKNKKYRFYPEEIMGHTIAEATEVSTRNASIVRGQNPKYLPYIDIELKPHQTLVYLMR